MNKAEARQRIRDKASYGCVYWSNHCKEQLLARGASTEDAEWVLFWGEISEVTESQDGDGWKIKIEGNDIDGDELTLIVALRDSDNAFFCITIHE